MVFGTFDLLHQGHISFLKQARIFGKRLVAVIARDDVVKYFKKAKPHQGELRRLARVRLTGIPTHVKLGDKEQGTYGIIKKVRPDIICLGYDQTTLKKDLHKRMEKNEIQHIKIVRLKAHKPEKFKTSIAAGGLLKKRIQSNS